MSVFEKAFVCMQYPPSPSLLPSGADFLRSTSQQRPHTSVKQVCNVQLIMGYGHFCTDCGGHLAI